MREQEDKRAVVDRIVHNTLKLATFLALLAGTLVLLPRGRFLEDFEPGRPAPSDLYAPFDFRVRKSPAQLEREREEAAARVAPILEYDNESKKRLSARLDSLRASLSDTGVLVISPTATGVLRGSPSILDEAFALAVSLSERGLVQDKNQLPPSSTREYIIIREDEERRVSDTLIKDTRSALERARAFAVSRYALEPDKAEAFTEAFGYLLSPTLVYDESATQKRREAAAAGVSEISEEFLKGQLVFTKGEIIDSVGAMRLAEIRKAMGTGGRTRWGVMLGIIIVFGLALAFFLVYRRMVPRWTTVLAVVIGYGLFFGTAHMVSIINSETLTPYLTLLPFLPIIVSIVLDSEAGVFLGFLEAIILSVLFGGDFGLLLYGVTVAGAAGLSSRIFKTRYQMYLLILVLFLAGAVSATGAFLLNEMSPKTLAFNCLWAMVSGFASVLLVFAALPIFEKVFRLSTDFLLSELASLQHPLLRELAEKAPGTFTHTILVGNLCEAGARAIGASPLLARVGAYYHDIGKLFSPDHFIENQKGQNPHDALAPADSANILRSHITEGERLADAKGLPKDIKRFISTHHGTSLMRQFYLKAKEADPGAPESAFRYPGPKPITPEEGICMLADACEAAVRALDEPSEAAIIRVVEEVFGRQVADGQLSEVRFTASQLEALKKAFIPVLVGTFHERIPYPE
ncbi:MAG: HDIG domain-containing metalloprotein [candidate division WOR-3 bacterium]